MPTGEPGPDLQDRGGRAGPDDRVPAYIDAREAGAGVGLDGAAATARGSEGVGVRAGTHVSSRGFYDSERRSV
jgi:hypothetical protein